MSQRPMPPGNTGPFKPKGGAMPPPTTRTPGKSMPAPPSGPITYDSPGGGYQGGAADRAVAPAKPNAGVNPNRGQARGPKVPFKNVQRGQNGGMIPRRGGVQAPPQVLGRQMPPTVPPAAPVSVEARHAQYAQAIPRR